MGELDRPQPFVLAKPGPYGIRITAVNVTAHDAGVRPGQSLADARAALPTLRTRNAEPTRDAAALRALARWTGRYGPSRNTDGADGLWIDITGVAHLFGGEAALCDDLQRRLTDMGLTPRFGIADTLGAAWALARFSSERPVFCLSGCGEQADAASRGALSLLPVEGLRIAPEAVLLLQRLGLYSIGQLYDLPRAALTRRFREVQRKARKDEMITHADAVMLRLDQALGVVREPRRPLVEQPARIVTRVFAEPLLSSVGIETATADCVIDLCRAMGEACEGLRRARLTLYRTDGTCGQIWIGTATTSRDARHMIRLLSDKLAAFDAGFGVDVVALEAVVVERSAPEQTASAALDHAPIPGGVTQTSIAQLADRLANRLGSRSVYRLIPCESHIPEHAEAALSVLSGWSSARLSTDKRHEWGEGQRRRPPFLLEAPEPITVIAEVPEGPPNRFVWRRLSHRIVKAQGPERIEPAWWRHIGAKAPKHGRLRDYYAIEDDRGGRYWVFREGLYERTKEEGPPGWYVHGLFG